MTVPELVPVPETVDEDRGDLAIMLTGGGARAAYQVGLLRGIARHFPNLRFEIITGVSAGAINAMFLAAKSGTLAEKVDQLTDLWCALECHHVFRVNYTQLIPFRTALHGVIPGLISRKPHGLFDSAPLASLLRDLFDCPIHRAPITGIRDNLAEGCLKAVALTGLDYATGQSVRWVQGRNLEIFEGTQRRNVPCELTVEHVLASLALPFVFPAVYIGDRWYGDGGIRLSAPLSPAVHLGARRILAMSTGHQRTPEEASQPVRRGYPPAAQLISQLVNAVFLDVIDEDVIRMQRMNEMIDRLPAAERNGFRRIELLTLRPSVDLGKLAADQQRLLPRSVRLFTRALGADETESPDFVSMLMFEPHYLRELIETGERDVESRLDDLRIFLDEQAGPREVSLAR
ncbi:MAG TPA: patatin-like phospholipase family protein [Thermoanaerobaculia bacterium]|nr:patatin-like phospholipase family protein [Thermoanaerobaculia bacterium]